MRYLASSSLVLVSLVLPSWLLLSGYGVYAVPCRGGTASDSAAGGRLLELGTIPSATGNLLVTANSSDSKVSSQALSVRLRDVGRDYPGRCPLGDACRVQPADLIATDSSDDRPASATPTHTLYRIRADPAR